MFGPNAGTPEGESHVLHPVTPLVDTNGLFTRDPLLRVSTLPSSTVTIAGPLGTVGSSAAGQGVQVAQISGAGLADGEYTITVSGGTVTDFFQLTISGHGDFADPGHWQHAFTPHMASLIGTLDPGESRSYKVLFDHLRGIQRIWLVDGGSPRIDTASLDTSQVGVVSSTAAYADAVPLLTIAGAGFAAGAHVLLDGSQELAVTASSATGLAATLPYGLAPGWHDLLVTNPDGTFSWFYGAVRGIEASDLAVDRAGRELPRFLGTSASLDLVVRNGDPAGHVAYRLDNGPLQALAGTTLALTGLEPGWHHATLELVAADGSPLAHPVRREISFETLPLRVDSAGAALPWPTRLSGGTGQLRILSGESSLIALDTGALPQTTRIAVTVDGKDGAVQTLPLDGPIQLDLAADFLPGAHVLRVQAVDASDRPLGAADFDTLLIWTQAGRRALLERMPVAAPGGQVAIDFRLVRGNDLPEYHYPVPVGGFSLESLPNDTTTPTLDGVALPAVELRASGTGTVRLQAGAPGDHVLGVEGAQSVLQVTNDTDADGLVNGFADSDTNGNGVPNASDPDMNGNGIPNALDGDVDGDTIPNGLDIDVNGNGVVNATCECQADGTRLVIPVDPDIDGDGVPNSLDPDIDGDGIPNALDPDPYGAYATAGLIAQNEFERHPTTVTLAGPGSGAAGTFVLPPETDPGGLVEYVSTLTGDGGVSLVGRTVYLIVTNPLSQVVGATYEAVTDAAGQARFAFHPVFVTTSDWRIETSYYGDWWYGGSEAHTVLSVHEPDQPTVHVLPPQSAGAGFTIDIDEQTPWNVTGTSWSSDVSIAVHLECLDCSLAVKSFTDMLAPGDIEGLSGFIHDTIAARNSAAVVGIWRATATGTDTGATYDLVFRVDLAPAPLCVAVVSASVPDLIAPDDSGRSSTDDVTNVNRPRFAVTSAPNLLVQLLEADAVLGSAFADDLGAALVQVDADHQLADGIHLIAARALTPSGAAGAASAALQATVDTVAPATPRLDLPAAEDSGASADDDVTNVAIVHFGGTTEADAVVLLQDALDGDLEVTADGAGAWAIQLGPLADGIRLLISSASDLAGNRSGLSLLGLRIDTTPPVLALPPDQAFEATSAAGANVDYVGASASDATSTTVVYSQASGTLFPLGMTAVTVTATDLAGNISSGSFAVVVRDTTAPLVTAPADQVAEATSSAGAVVAYPPAGASDAVGPVSLGYSQASGTTFALGHTTVTVTATDGAGNASTATFDVFVRDTTAPALTVPANVVAEATSAAGAIVTYPPATATDAVGPVTFTYSTASGTQFALGTTTVTVTATDGAGNSSTGSFTVTVRDTLAPVLTVPANVVAEATSAAGAIVTYPPATATDAVGPVTFTYSTASGAQFALGTTTVTVTATDGAGNSSTGSFTVTVRDTTAPVGTVSINGGAATTTSPTVTLTLAFTDAVSTTSMRFSTDGGATWSAWEAYATTKTLTLPSPDGTKTAIAQVSDAAGNIGSASDSITLATAPPPPECDDDDHDRGHDGHGNDHGGGGHHGDDRGHDGDDRCDHDGHDHDHDGHDDGHDGHGGPGCDHGRQEISAPPAGNYQGHSDAGRGRGH